MEATYGADQRVGVGRIDNLVVYLEREIPQQDPHLDWLDQALSETVARHDSRTAYLHVVEVRGRRMPQRNGPREGFVRLARAYDGRLGAAAFVVPDSGFGAAMVKSIITGVLMVVKPASPTRSFRSLERALPWLESCCPALPDAHDVLQFVSRLRTR